MGRHFVLGPCPILLLVSACLKIGLLLLVANPQSKTNTAFAGWRVVLAMMAVAERCGCNA